MRFGIPETKSLKSTHPWIESSKFEERESHELLREIVDRVRVESRKRASHGGKPIKVIFDVDGTIFDVKPRSLRILKEFASTAEARSISEKIAAWSLGLRSHNLSYTLEESAMANNIPQDPKAKEYMKKAFHFWRERFFTDEYVLMDRPLPGAAAYANAIVDAGATAVYLTGCDWPGMGRGTRASLAHWGFPTEERTSELIMKPNSGLDDAEFKDSALRDLRIHSEAIAFFDNEPANFHVFEKNFPDAYLVFFYSNCSQKEAKPVNKLYKIENFLF